MLKLESRTIQCETNDNAYLKWKKNIYNNNNNNIKTIMLQHVHIVREK